MRNKILMTLVALFTMTAGAWADGVKIKFAANGNEKVVTVESLPHTFWCNNDNASDELDLILQELYGWPNNSDKYYCNIFEPYPSASGNDKVTAGIDGDNHYVTIAEGFEGSATVTGQYSIVGGVATYELAISLAEPDGPEVTWDPATKTGTFEMPAFDVEIAPIYAPVAQWATEGTEPEVKTLLPEAAEGVIADTDAPLIVEGTVAFAGTSTEVKQGIVMYAVTPATITEAPALDAANKWSADVPTAKLVADGGVDVKVWYYIKGADAPEGEKATAENTFNDSEICATPITVTVLSNKFDIEFKAANANTIEAGKATVTVGGTPATVTEGKLEGVKMGTEVKVKAKDGYKFRKVEAKKGGLLSITIGGSTTATIYYVEGETWAQALQNHPEENAAWGTDPDGDITGNGNYLSAGDGFVNSNSIIDPNAGYTFGWT